MLKRLARRTFLKNKWKFLATGLMAFFVVILWMGTASSSLPIQYNLEKMPNEPYYQEDFQMQTYTPLNEEDINYLEDEYDIVIDDIKYKTMNTEVKMDVQNMSYIWDVSQGTSALSGAASNELDTQQQAYFQVMHEDVDVQYFLDGTEPIENNEIAISPHFATAYGVEVGETILLDVDGKEQEFVVTGIYGDPGIVSITNNLVSISNPLKLNLFMVNESTYSAMSPDTNEGESANFIYGARFNDKSMSKDAMIDTYATIRTDEVFNKVATTCYPNPYDANAPEVCTTQETNALIALLPKDSNTKISLADTTVVSKTSSTMILALFISLIVIVVMMIITSKIIDGYRKEIGVLKAFGYEKNEIIRAFYIYPVIFFTIPIVLGIIAAAFLANYFITLYADMFIFLPTSFSLFYPENIIMLVIIFGTYFIGIYFAINKVIKQDVLSLFSGVADRNKKVRKMSYQKGFKRRFKSRLLWSNPGKIFAIFLGITASASLIGYSMMLVWGIVDTFNSSLAYANYEAVTIYEQPETDKPAETEFYATGLNVISVDYNHDLATGAKDINNEDQVTLPLYATSVDNPGFNIELTDSSIDVEKAMQDGIVISGIASQTYDIQTGDVINVKTPYSPDLITYEVTGVAQGNGSPISFIDVDDYLADTNLNTNTRNANMTNDVAGIDVNDYASVVTKQQLQSQIFASIGVLSITILIMAIVSFGIMLPIVSSLSTIIIKDNTKNIGVMKAFGYTKREIKNIILDIYSPIVVIGSLAGYVLAYFINVYISRLLSQYLGYGIQINFVWWILIAVIAIVYIVYWLNIQISARKLNKVDVKEVLTKE